MSAGHQQLVGALGFLMISLSTGEPFLILDEPITVWTLSGTLLILTGVAGVFQSKVKPRVSEEG